MDFLYWAKCSSKLFISSEMNIYDNLGKNRLHIEEWGIH